MSAAESGLAGDEPPALIAREVDPVGTRLRDTMYLFLARLFDPSLALYGGGGDEAGHREEEVRRMDYIARQLIRISTTTDWKTCVIRWEDLSRFEEAAATLIESDYMRFAPYLNNALHLVLTQYMNDDYANRGKCDPAIAFSGVPRCFSIRTLRAALVGQLCSVKGVVTRTSQVRPELLAGVFRCNDCGTESLPIEQYFNFTEPPACRNQQCENKTRFQLIPTHPLTTFGDWQKIRVQEDTNNIPPGCMPRTIEVIARDDAVEVAKPGDRIIAIGCPIVVPEVAKLFGAANRREVQRQTSGAQRAHQEAQKDLEGLSGLRALGVRELSFRMCFLATTIADDTGDDRKMTEAVKDSADGAAEHEEVRLSPAERDRIVRMRQHDNLLKTLTACVAPNIFRHDVVKLGLLLQMVGGVSKSTMERIALRGDINMCIVGDPSTAKSQFLKWIANHAPRGIYTSGKASTASGLTATVTRDADTGERTIEAGALMLSDRGICCIDEFDKMDIKDQVAIHEAMEQQTISIAKAGIKATLNAKTSLLAALNPIGGKYDRRKPLQKNIAMSAPIMSRFDLMFVIVDDASDDADFAIASQLLRLHRLGDEALLPPFSADDFKLYIRFCRSLTPRLTEEAVGLIVAAYREMRLQDSLSNRSKVYRVTTRLLESIIRLAEATAKLHLATDVTSYHVDIALELMRQSLSTVDMTEVELTAVDTPSGAPISGSQAPAEVPSESQPAVGAESCDGEGGGSGPGTRAHRSADKSNDKQAGRSKGKANKENTVRVSRSTRDVPKSHSTRPTKVFISPEHHFSIVQRLTARLVSLGVDAAPTREELVRWYLGQLSTLNTTQLEREMRYGNMVITKLIQEGKLLEVAPEEGDEPRIFLDPNFNPDYTTW